MIRGILLACLLLIMMQSQASAAISCDLSATGVSFGQYSGSQLTNTGSIVVHCTGTGSTTYRMSLSTGSGTYADRVMTTGSNKLSYNLYKDSARSQIWGDGSGGSTTVTGQINMGFQSSITFTITVYGKVPVQSLPAPGSYSDLILVTMIYAGFSSASTSFFDTASVKAGCTVSASDLQFFTFTGAQLDAQSQITVTCTNTTPWNAGLNQGTFPGATVTTRRMTGPPPSASLGYAMYRNATRTLNWGNTVGTDTQSGTGTGSAQTLTVYGRIPAATKPVAGGYHDTITATLTF